MSKGSMMTKVNRLISKIFPSELTPNIYAYPEVKILNYLDAQYYGYVKDYIDKSTLEILHNHSELSSILDHLTFGSLLKNADFLQLATFTNTLTLQRAQPTSTMEPISTLPMDQEQFQDLLDRTQPGLLDLKPRIHSLLKLLNYMVLAS